MSRLKKTQDKLLDRPLTPAEDVWRRLWKNKAAMAGLIVIIIIVMLALFADVIADYDTEVIGSFPEQILQGPSREHIFGTDNFGRDIFARIVHGARYSLTFGVVCVFFAMLFGTILGAVSAFFGGKVDAVITYIVDTVICIPSMLLSLSLVAVLGKGFVNLIIAITIANTPGFARIVRSAMLSISGQEYIEAARATGVSSVRTIFVHAIPNAIGMIIVNATMNVAGLIMVAASLSFIGMGIQPPAPEWGTMVSEALNSFRMYPHAALFPGLAIVITAISFNLLGDGLADALDPRMKE